MFFPVILAAARITTKVIPATKAPQTNLACSTSYGCEVVVEGARLQDVKMWTSHIIARVVGSGDDGTPARIQMLPLSAFTSQPDGSMIPVSGKLTIVSTDGREYTVIVDAVDVPRVNRVWFSGVNSSRVVATQVVGASAQRSGEAADLDPSKMDFGWSSSGAIRCAGLFSIGSQLWCKLPRDLADVPSVYFDDGRLKVPANARVVAQYYLVIENAASRSSVLLEIGGGNPRSGHIQRTHE